VWGDLAERTGNTPTPHQFVGALGYEREADSGLYFIGTRYYDPSVGRFISQDAAQWGVNWYVYAANNPVGNYDSGGLRPAMIHGGGGYSGGGCGGGGPVSDGRDWFDKATDFMAGMGDKISLGLTDVIRDWMGTNDSVDKDSGWYTAGGYAGDAWWIAFGTAGIAGSAAAKTENVMRVVSEAEAQAIREAGGLVASENAILGTRGMLTRVFTEEAREKMIEWGLSEGRTHLVEMGVKSGWRESIIGPDGLGYIVDVAKINSYKVGAPTITPLVP